MKVRNRPQSLLAVAVLVLLVWSGSMAGTLVRFDDIREERIYMQGFTVNKRATVQIEAVGASGKPSDYMVATGWVIDADSREPVWALTADNSRSSRRDHGKREAKEKITLSPGDYEAYYYAGEHFYADIKIRGAGDLFEFLGNLFAGRVSRDWDRLLDDFMMEIRAQDRSQAAPNSKGPQVPKGLIEFTQVGDSFYKEAGFSLKGPSGLKIYALGEYSESDRVMVDYGWIINAETRERVWEMDRWNTEDAGGAAKNRLFKGSVELPAGNYIVIYASDDSHSAERFNATPPYDPYAWGMVLAGAGKEFDKEDFSRFTSRERGTPLVRITGVGDNQYQSQGFTLKKKMPLHILCLGEYGRRDRQMVDYGWIEDHKTAKKVWIMTADNSRHAGGAAKNRVYDGVITLQPGDYVVHYLTDDCHSYEHWNDSPPFNPRDWGITLTLLDDRLKHRDFELFEEEEKEGPYLVEIIRLGDDVKRRERFKLDKITKVHVYAIGEGDRDQMYDYGWIEDARTGRVVWEMTYRMTQHAGGAKKNRMFDDTILLDKGEYLVHFVTDGSHSFGDWNAARPRDPSHWGITIRKLK